MAIETGTISNLPELKKIDYSALDFDTIKPQLITYIKENYPDEQNDFLETNTGVMMLDVVSYVADILSYRADFLANENFLSTARTKKAILNLLELINYTLGRQSASVGDVQCILIDADSQLLDGSGQLIQDVVISSLEDRTVITTKDDANDILDYEVFKSSDDLTSSVVIPAGTPINGIVNAAIIEGQTQIDILTTDANRSANQRFALDQQNALVESIFVTVNGVLYTQVDNLAYENGATQTYVIEFDADNNADILFGDNTFGAIPPSNAELIIIYRYGGGKKGNIIKSNLNTSKSYQLNGRSFTIQYENITATTGGKDEETIAHAKNFAPKAFKTQVREVTGEDYSVFASGYSDGTNGSIEKSTSGIRSYLSAYGGNTSKFTIDGTNNQLSFYVINTTITVVLDEGTDLSLNELITNFNDKIDGLRSSTYDPPIVMESYACNHYHFVGTIPEVDAGYVIDNTNFAFKVNFDGTVYTANIPLGTYLMDEIITILNSSFNTGDNSYLKLFRVQTSIDANTGYVYMEVLATKNIKPALTEFKLVTTGNSAYAQFGLTPESESVEFNAYCPMVTTTYHHPELTLEAMAVTNHAYDILGMRYSSSGNGLGKAYPCSANYVDIYVLSRGDNDNLTTPSNALKDALKDFMGRFKQLTDQITIWDGDLKVINMDLTITITRGYRKDLIEPNVDDFIDNFFDPENNSFGLSLHISKVYEGIEAITGINNVLITDVEEDAISQTTTGTGQIRNVDVSNNQIWTRGSITITYEYSSL